MVASFLKKLFPTNRLRVKQFEMPLMTSKLLGSGIDVMTLPEGHMSCVQCQGYKFECWNYGDSHRIELGCMACGESYRLLFPLDIVLPEKQGRYSCLRHPSKGMIVIHNIDVLSVGCECCYTEMNIQLKTKSNIILADA